RSRQLDDVGEDFGKRVRMLAEDGYRSQLVHDLARGHGADAANVLGDHQVRLQPADGRRVDLVQGVAALGGEGHLALDVAARAASEVVDGPRDDRPPPSLWRVIAL